MTVGRNDLCPCGSGKKYKKCCMNKNKVVQFHELQEEKFYQQKNMLVNKLRDFMEENVSQSLYYSLKSQFKKRARQSGDHQGIFEFWLYFFYRFENGMRGVEWFLSENQHRLSTDEKKMMQRWTTLKPQLVQAIHVTSSHVTYMDYFTRETYNLPNTKEHIPMCIPWHSTLAVLEPMGDNFYFNGVRRISSPEGLKNAANLVNEIMQEKGLDREQALLNYYPEILAALMNDKSEEDYKEKEIVQYTYDFLMIDKERAENLLYNDHDFAVDHWEEKTKRLSWVGEVHAYTDSEQEGQVKLAEVHAFLEIDNKTLTFVTYDLDVVIKFLRKVLKVDSPFELVNDKEEKIKVPLNAELKQMAISMEKGVPEYFALYAQNHLLAEIDHPIPKYDHLSLRELVEAGKQNIAELWLQQSEFNVNQNVLAQYGQIEVTADFNTVRKELGLELSPFVTGGEKRHTALERLPIQQATERPIAVLEADISIYEDLGFTTETLNAFYTQDIIAFYQEKTYGKSKATERKYRNSLYDIREVLENSQNKSWADCDSDFWESLLAKDFFKLYINVSKSMVKDMVTVVKSLTSWLAKGKKLNIAKDVTELAKYFEPRMLNAVQLLEHENPYLARAYHPEINEVGSELKHLGKNFGQRLSGNFKIISVNKRSVRTINLENSKELTISVEEKAVQYAEEGMILTGNIGKSKSLNVWEIIYLERVSFVRGVVRNILE
ncbi:hypothetical protein HNQ94_000013 [Salirhabdus euzebyi]|uniref:SEC-C motif-containing protein n=1 Tax=Salirhabdus euzebyi TaxID=394506 RepID=A0A841Q148_9BACI|nr:SEC-C domain-containing protein [Salirhabdus euzebyi]MBB6451592.1 hypothetical protein [Salirhabdus euzebyi]